MAITNRDRIERALELLRQGLGPFVEREVQPRIRTGVVSMETLRRYAEDPKLSDRPIEEWDVSGLLRLMTDTWNSVFRDTLGYVERSLVSEIRGWRNRWAHQEAFTSDDTDRALDSIERLLNAVSASEQAAEVARMKRELRRLVYDEQVRSEKRKAGGSLIEAAATGALKPWREVIQPHPDVASGRYQQAEFAADLWQVHLGEGSDEYRDPAEFFRRTYLTESLKRLLVGAVERVHGQGGDPVVQLQTNFGGGKTHSMLALYHLFSGCPLSELPGVEALLAELGVSELPAVRRVVLVGNKISPGNPVQKTDGTVVRTLWGELAWQLGGKEAYARIAADDEKATSPGDALRELLRDYGPALILIDEWVAYARQLHDESDLPGGSFETQFTFAQALTEAVKLAGNSLLVVSLPASDTGSSTAVDDVEVGGLRGREALERLRNVVGRLESSWRPATAEEGFEIVRRRLFEPLAGDEAFKQRDVTARAFADLYRANSAEFPPECRTGDYETRLKAAYPIHPEIFDQLYGGWSTLVKFQRTRGVLRLMAAVIHSLWEKGDRAPLILPSSIPIDDARVQFELTRYLSDNWVPIIEKDVDGPQSLPLQIDAEVPNLGKYSATRRVARTIYLGSAPRAGASQRGLEDRRIKLGSVLPGEPTAVFGDALRRLAARATYLYQDGTHFWYSTQPTVTKLAEDRAEQLLREPDRIMLEIERRLQQALREKGDFVRVHPVPRTSADVADEAEARLVVLPPDQPYHRDGDSPAEGAAREILANRGNSPRLFQNTLVFLAADKIRMQDLDEAVRRFLAWQSILDEKEALNLDPHQVRQAETQWKAADSTVTARLPEVYQWALVPEQKDPGAPVTWQAIRLSGGDPLAVRVSKRLRRDELLITSLGATILRKYLDEVPLWRGDHVPVRQLVEDFARYLYLPRLQRPEVLVEAIRSGVALLTWEQDAFAYAEDYDEAAGRYRGLRAGETVALTVDSPGLVVRPDVARRQREAERARADTVVPPPPPPGPTPGMVRDDGTAVQPDTCAEVATAAPRRFYGTVRLDPTRTGRDAGRIAEEVIAHLTGQVGAEVTVTLEIHAHLPEGASDHLVRTVTENARTLGFESFGFEEE
ncbi:AAA+ family ATPase [Rhodothermaceae bacterium RA]|nr:AAA+ family ATPase [Rhodothermaceae bacterium RA]